MFEPKNRSSIVRARHKGGGVFGVPAWLYGRLTHCLWGLISVPPLVCPPPTPTVSDERARILPRNSWTARARVPFIQTSRRQCVVPAREPRPWCRRIADERASERPGSSWQCDTAIMSRAPVSGISLVFLSFDAFYIFFSISLASPFVLHIATSTKLRAGLDRKNEKKKKNTEPESQRKTVSAGRKRAIMRGCLKGNQCAASDWTAARIIVLASLPHVRPGSKLLRGTISRANQLLTNIVIIVALCYIKVYIQLWTLLNGIRNWKKIKFMDVEKCWKCIFNICTNVCCNAEKIHFFK